MKANYAASVKIILKHMFFALNNFIIIVQLFLKSLKLILSWVLNRPTLKSKRVFFELTFKMKFEKIKRLVN